MCGIAGVFSTDPEHRVEPRLLRAMADTIAHRGPDDEGYHLAGPVGLAHRRLSIIDVAHGAQPLANEDGNVVVVFNGEIYNHEDLRRDLTARGHRFATRADTEVLVHGWEEWGADLVHDLRGMFAFAVHDRRRRRLLLARDRLGIKPVYYWTDSRTLVFASEIKALLRHPSVPREVDPEALDHYLSLRYVPGPRTLFRGIRKLQPGHLLVADENGFRVRRYWEVPLREKAEIDEAEARERFRDLFDESVAMRLMSEVPLGVFLSGGIDSTAVLGAMDHVSDGRTFSSFSIGYEAASEEEERANELSWARLAADRFHSDHHEVRLSPADFQDALPRLAWHLDEPVADPACVPLYFLSKRASRDVTVVLSGEGADEILGGYGIYPRMLALESLYRRGGWALRPVFSALARMVPDERIRHYLQLAGRPLTTRYRGVSRGFLPETKDRLTGRSDAGDSGLDEILRERFGPGDADPLDRMLRFDLQTWLPDDLLVKADKMTMAHSQELRVPFLDHRLVELAVSLPPRLKIRGRTGKAILREAVAPRVPRPILERTKKGFPVPTGPLLRHLEGFVRDLLLGKGSATRDWFEVGEVERLLDEHREGRAERGQEIWSLVLFDLWHGAFLDRRFRPHTETSPEAAPARAAG